MALLGPTLYNILWLGQNLTLALIVLTRQGNIYNTILSKYTLRSYVVKIDFQLFHADFNNALKTWAFKIQNISGITRIRLAENNFLYGKLKGFNITICL